MNDKIETLNNIFCYIIFKKSLQLNFIKYNSLSEKLYLHYDWKVLFKNEIEQNISKILNKCNSKENIEISIPNLSSLYHQKPKINFAMQNCTDFSDFVNNKDNNLSFEKFCCGCLNGNYYNQKFLRKKLKELKINNPKYDHPIEQIIDDRIDLYNELELNSYINNNIDLITDKFIIEFGEIESTMEKISLFHYNFFLITKLEENHLDLKDLEYNIWWTTPQIFERKLLSKTQELSYKWKTSKFSDLKEIYKKSKLNFPNSTLKMFTSIFNNLPIDSIQPLETSFSLAELIYFIHLLNENEFLVKESNFSTSRFQRCFIGSNGKSFNSSSIKSTKSQLLNIDINISSKVLQSSKRHKIESIFKDL